MPQIRRTRADTVNGAVEQFRDANSAPPLEWDEAVQLPADPAEREQALAIFNDLLSGRNREHWRPHHARLLSETALITGQISVMTNVLIRTGSLAKGKNGHTSRSPVLDALSMLQSLRMQNYKSLDLIGARASEDSRSKGANKASQLIKRGDYDDLLAH
jgi:hypothetical protein